MIETNNNKHQTNLIGLDILATYTVQLMPFSAQLSQWYYVFYAFAFYQNVISTSLVVCSIWILSMKLCHGWTCWQV